MDVVELYKKGRSIPQVSEETGVPLSTVRFRLKSAGVLRGRSEAVRLAGGDGRLGGGMRGKKRVFSEEHKALIAEAARTRADLNASGTYLNSSGYLEYTRGPNKGRSVHVVKMESRIGRRLNDDECVHHIDGDRTNNDENNIALLTRSGHARLHRHEDALANKTRERDENGRFC